MTAKGFWKRLPLLSAVLLQPAAAFATEGLPDTSLHGTGYAVLTDLPIPYPRDLTVDSSGRFLVSGLGGGAYIVARRLPDGSQDTTFGDAGATVADFPSLGYLAEFGAMRHLPIPGGGYYAHLRISSAQNGDGSSGVVRMTATGALDVTFGSGGMLVEMPGFSAAAVDTDQRLAVLGVPVSGAVYSAATPYVLRLTATGTRDPTFNGGNRLPITNLTTASDIARAPGGGYYVGGSIQISAQPTQYIVGAIRLFADGTRDMDFGNGGVAYAQFGVGADHSNRVLALTVQDDGKLLLAGISGSPSRCFVTRLLSDGQLDTSFGTGGQWLQTEPTALGSPCFRIAQATGGRILAMGYRLESGIGRSTPFIIGLRNDGSADSGFGTDGVAWPPPHQPGWNYPWGLALDRQQRPNVLAINGGSSTVVYRLTSDLIFENAFGL